MVTFKELYGASFEHVKVAFLDELNAIAEVKQAAELTEAGRAHIKDKNFAVSAEDSPTGKPAYPIHDKAHAANALARVKQHGSPELRAKVYAAVAKAHPELAARSDVPAVRTQAAKLAGLAAGLKHDAGELTGLGILAIPSVDTLQAKWRARKDADPHAWEKKRYLGEGAHAGLELGGLGVLAGDTIWKARKHP